MNISRCKAFDKWWKRNHHDVKAHTWLAKHAKRVIHNYNAPPEQFDHTNKLLKRFNLSEYKRFNAKSAEFLWRLTHPGNADRKLRLLATATFLQEKMDASGRKMGK
tara:strand:- start:2492 stop:2809 length:318 start_codon:yes stop_codon:yes gene_type:complete